MADSELALHKKLIDIQQNLQVQKLRENSFGGYNYRNVEDIEAAVKPFLKKHHLVLFFTDEVVGVEGRVYVKATAHLSDGEIEIKVSAFARESEKPKAKTDDAQLTGGCSSYARKYAANGLFLIDDGKGDPDNPDKGEDANVAGMAQLTKGKARLFDAFKKAKISESTEMLAVIERAVGKQSVETVSDVDKVLAELAAGGEDD